MLRVFFISIVLIIMPSISDAEEREFKGVAKHFYKDNGLKSGNPLMSADFVKSKFGADRLIDSVVVDENNIFYWVYNTDSEGLKMGYYNKIKNKTSIFDELSGIKADARLTNVPTMFVFKDTKHGLENHYVVSLYAKDEAGPGAKIYAADYFLNVYKITDDGTSTLVGEEEIGSSIAYFDGSSDKSEILEPRVFVADILPNKFIEVVVWIKKYEVFKSRAVFKDEELFVLNYNPKSGKFMKFDNLKITKEIKDKVKWDELPNVEEYHGLVLPSM